MNENDSSTVIRSLWDRARTIYVSTLQTDEERGKAERYFSMITAVENTDGNFHVKTSNEFAATLLNNDYAAKLKMCIGLAGGSPDTEVIFTMDETLKQSIVVPPQTNQARRESINEIAESDDANANVPKFTSTMQLNPNYTFNEFVRGPSNSLANATALSVAERPGWKYNPLFIYGGTGLGKTHLMQAIGNELIKRRKYAVCYLTAEAFMNDFVNAIQNDWMDKFRDRYRKIDILLVDDIQFIATRKNFQEEFFNTFTTLYAAGKQIVMTSDVAPKNLHGFEQRLISRFEGGMVQEIEMPSYETRLAILQKKAESIQPTIPDNALRFIADNIKSHVRAMEGALAKVTMMMNASNLVSISDEMLHRLLADLIEKENKLRKITIEEIQKTVCKKYGVTMAQMLSSERTQSLVTPRQLAMYIARKYTAKRLPDIAKMFDKSHATIIHGVKNIEKRIDVEPDLKESLEEIISTFGYNIEDEITD